jgi:DNA modification methylase
MTTTTTPELTREELHVLERLAAASYQDVADETGWSRGRIHRLALRVGARKTESRIREKAADRKARQREILETLINESVTADVLDFLDGIPDASVQLIVTSIPYNVGKRYGDAVGADAMRHLYYAGWLRQIVSELARIVKNGGTVFLESGATKDDDGSMVPIDVMLFEDLRRAGLTYRNRIIWPSSHGLTPKNRLAERYETVLVFSKGEQTWNPNAARTPQLQPGKRGYKPGRESFGELTGHPLGAAGTDVWWDVRHLKANDPELSAHPAAFPIALAKKAILTYSRPGDIVVDPFVGSGSTQIAAVETGRNFIGADLFYADLRRERLAEAMPDLVTRLPGVSEASLAVWQAEARRRDILCLPIPDAVDRQLVAEVVLENDTPLGE